MLYRGEGVKSTDSWLRFRVTHDLVEDPAKAYFDLASLTGETEYQGDHEGGPGAKRGHVAALRAAPSSATEASAALAAAAAACCASVGVGLTGRGRGLAVGVAAGFAAMATFAAVTAVRGRRPCDATWLRFEPFILHVCCRDFAAASALIASARLVFKNVGLTGWGEGKLIVAIWGDEGLDMPLTSPHGVPLFPNDAVWLQSQVNDRHRRNWAKIDRFTAALREMGDVEPDALAAGLQGGFPVVAFPRVSGEDEEEEEEVEEAELDRTSSAIGGQRKGPRAFDVVGDVALLHKPPPPDDRAAVGAAILKELPKVSVVAVRVGAHSPPLLHSAMEIIAGRREHDYRRTPLVTTHLEFGVRFVVDLGAVFFSTRMAAERQRLCCEVVAGERVLVPFAGCGPEALQIAVHTKCAEVVAIELNPDAAKCARRGVELLQRAGTAGADAAKKVSVVEGDVCEAVSGLPSGTFDRIVAPRPKGSGDGDGGGESNGKGGDEGAAFLQALLPLLRSGGVCHWYDFVADWELPTCERSRAFLEAECAKAGLRCNVVRAAPANRRSIAERQFRAVLDFEVHSGSGGGTATGVPVESV